MGSLSLCCIQVEECDNADLVENRKNEPKENQTMAAFTHVILTQAIKAKLHLEPRKYFGL